MTKCVKLRQNIPILQYSINVYLFAPLFRRRELTRRPYGHFAAFRCFQNFFVTYIGVFFVSKHKTNKLN